jgi:hypothetical protein
VPVPDGVKKEHFFVEMKELPVISDEALVFGEIGAVMDSFCLESKKTVERGKLVSVKKEREAVPWSSPEKELEQCEKKYQTLLLEFQGILSKPDAGGVE